VRKAISSSQRVNSEPFGKRYAISIYIEMVPGEVPKCIVCKHTYSTFFAKSKDEKKHFKGKEALK